MKRLLRVDCRKRLTAQGALSHPFIANKHFERRLEVDSTVLGALCHFGQQAKFRRCCLFIMAWSLSEEERAEVENAFLAIDTHHTGRLSYEELREIMVEQYHMPEDSARTAFRALSVHSDGDIHFSDFLAAMVSSRIALHNDLLHDCFNKFDLDGSGYLTTEHLRKVLGETFDGTQTKTMLQDVGTLHPDRMTWHEFAAYMQGRPLRWRGDELVNQPMSCSAAVHAQMCTSMMSRLWASISI